MAELTLQDLSAESLLTQLPKVPVGKQLQPSVDGVALLAKLGEGSSGAVYRGRSEKHGGDVAVRIMAAYDQQSERFQRFFRDVESAKSVKSPRLIDIFELSTEGEICYQICEFFPSISAQTYVNQLKERLAPGMKEAQVLDACLAATEGLLEAHALNVLHRDLRPSSLLISGADGQFDFSNVKLADLGLALNDGVCGMLQGSAAEAGTPGFMSPEQAGGARELTPACDVFGMGATMYGLLVGQPPFGGFTITLVLQATMTQEVADLRTWRPDVTRATAKLIEICMRKEPARRFSSAKELLQALKTCRMAVEGNLDAQLDAIKVLESLVPGGAPVHPATALPDAIEDGIRSAVTTTAPGRHKKVALPPPPTMIVPTTAFRKNETTLYKDLLSPKSSGGAAAPPPPVLPRAAASALVPALAEVTIEPAEEQVSDAPAQPSALEQQEWQDPALLAAALESPEPAPRRSKAPLWLAALLALCACGGGAWYLGYLNPWLGAKVASKQDPTPAPAPPADAPPAPAPGDQSTATPPTATPPSADPETANLDARKAELEAFAKAEAEAKLKADAELKAKAEAAAKARLEAEAKQAAEAAEKARLQALANAQAKAKAEEEAKALAAKTEEEAKALAAKKAEEEALAAKKAEEEAKAKAEEEAKVLAAKKAEEEAQAAQTKAEEEARALAAQKAGAEAQARAAAEQEAKVAAATKAEAEKVAKAAAAEQARLEAALRAKAEAEAKAKTQSTSSAEAWRKREAALPKEITLDLGEKVSIDFVFVPSGTFAMGSDRATLSDVARSANADAKDFFDETPAHKVKVPGFYISKTPVTVGQFRRFASETRFQSAAEKRGEAIVLHQKKWQRMAGANWMKPGFEQSDEHPVVLLSYKDCEAFVNWATQLTSKGLRMPTETEWEYAARGPQARLYPWGDKWDHGLANHSDSTLKHYCVQDWNYSEDRDGYAFTSPVGKFGNASWCGALDMAGNVSQWCADVYEPYPQSGTAPVILSDPSSLSKDAKMVVRGGSYLLRAVDCRGAARRPLSPRTWSGDVGMRLVFALE